jgi:hypothetical protein
MATIQARANVLSSISVIGTHDLDFGAVMPGMSKPIDKSSVGSAGEWIITGIPTAEVTLSFDLPDSLKEIDGTDALPIGFSLADASYDDGTSRGQEAPAGVLNPHHVSTKRLGASGLMTVWIGGVVFPSRSQVSGLYGGRVTLTVIYTGN